MSSNKFESQEYFKHLSLIDENTIVHKSDNNKEEFKLVILRIFITLLNVNEEKSYYFECFDINNEDEEIEIMKSKEMKGNNNIIIFKETIEIRYNPINDKRILIKIHKDENILYYETDLNRLTESINIEDKIDNINPEIIQISSLKLNKFVLFLFEINSSKKIDFKKAKNKIIYQIKNNNVLLYRSEPINENGKFKVVEISQDFLYPNFTILFYNYEGKILTEIKLSIKDFQNEELMGIPNVFSLSKNKVLTIENKSLIKEDLEVKNFLNENELKKNDDLMESKSEIFFKVNKKEIDYNKERIKLSFMLEKCKPSTFYNIRVYYDENDTQQTFSTKDFKSNEDKIEFPENLEIDYFFNKDRIFEISIIVNKSFKRSEVTLAQILFCKNSIYEAKVSNDVNEIIKIKAEKIIDMNLTMLNVNFEITSFLNPKYYLNKLYFIMNVDQKKIYKSEEINSENQINSINVPNELIDNENKNIIFDFYNYRNEGLESINTNKEELINGKTFEIILSKYRKYIFKSKSKIIDNYSLFNCINEEELKIYPYFFIDFSLSNGEKDSKKCLHYLSEDEDEQNEYEEILSAYFQENIFYNPSNIYLMYGFGGEKNGNEIFEFNSHSDINKDNFIEEYRNNISEVTFKEKRLFSNILKKYIEKGKNYENNNKFDIIFILTSDFCSDEEETKKTLFELENTPVFIIIIGMGNKNFNEFQEFIDNINSNLKSRKKLIQLEKYKNNRYNLNQLVENSLKNIPNEIINYFLSKNKKYLK